MTDEDTGIQVAANMHRPELTPQQTLALAFCKECLGWTQAIAANDYGLPYVFEYVSRELASSNIQPWQRSFHPGNLGAVVKAVRDWCDRHAATLILKYFPSGSADDCWHASLTPYAEAQSDNACDALLLACVAAQRSIKGKSEAISNAGDKL